VAPSGWKEFEKLAYEIQKELAGEAVVTLHEAIQGVDSGIQRQIDISIRQRVGQYSILVIADCKAHKDPIDINTVEQFVTTLRDVRANKGALIASNGFTEAAIALARTYGIDTFTLVDTAHTSWRAYVSLPTLLVRSYLKAVAFDVSGRSTDGGAVFPAGDPSLWELCAQDGRNLGTARNLFAQKWNAHEIPYDPGLHNVVLAETATLKVGNGHTVSVSASYEALRGYYFGPVPLKVRGFHDAQTGGLITRSLQTDTLSPYEIERGLVPGWRKIEGPNSLAVRPVMQLEYSDSLPTPKDAPN